MTVREAKQIHPGVYMDITEEQILDTKVPDVSAKSIIMSAKWNHGLPYEEAKRLLSYYKDGLKLLASE